MSVARALGWINGRFGRRPFYWGVVLAVLAVGLCFVPLFDLLGYDFAFVVGLVAAFAAVDVGQGTVAAARQRARSAGLMRLVADATVAALSLLALPLLAALANALRVRNCNLGAGLAFYALLPVGSVLLAAPAGVLAGVLISGRRRGRLLALALPMVSILWALGRAYFDPPVFAFDAFGGFFPGPIYDEALRPPLRLLWFRLANLTSISAALALGACCTSAGAGGIPQPGWRTQADRPSLGLVALTLALVGGALGWRLAEPALGFHLDKGDLLDRLSRETRSQHFVMHSDPAGEPPAELDLVHRDLEFRYHQLARILGAEPAVPITVYRFASAAQKKALTGAGSTLYAKPWRREIYVQAERFPAERLRHELAHVFAGAFGDPVFGVSLAWRWWGPLPVPRLSSGLIEGIAEAADFGDPGGRETLHQEARAMIDNGHAPPLARVLGVGFSVESGARAYTLAGSFCRFLLDEFGAAKLRAIYASAGDFSAVYARDLARLEQDWHAFLRTQPVDAAARAEAEERFRRPAIFKKVCARELAARVGEARGWLWSWPAESARLFASVCSDDPGEPAYRVDLAESLAAAGEAEHALALLADFDRRDDLTRPLRARSANLAAAIHFHAGRLPATRAAVERVLELVSDEGDERTSRARLRSLADAEARATLGRVLFGDAVGRPVDSALVVFLIDEFARRFADEALGPYLVGRQLALRDPYLAVAPLQAACPLAGPGMPEPLPPVFVRECRRMLGRAAFLAGNWPLARAVYEAMRGQAELQADALRAGDFLERIDWESRRAGRP